MKLSEVSSKYGAPMGRPNQGPTHSEEKIKLHLQHMPLNSGGYDSGGAYWGLRVPVKRTVECRPIEHPANEAPIMREITSTPRIYRYWNEAEGIDGEVLEGTLDAFDRKDAKAQLLEKYPNATFYR